MNNEILLIISLLGIYTAVLAFYKLFGRSGLYVWTAIATIAANIEVLIMVDAFGMSQTLGNILFASTFLVTDILSELEGVSQAKKAVKMGIMTSVSFIFISQSWLLYDASNAAFIDIHFDAIFQSTTRMLLVGIIVYAIAQVIDVWLYHFIWQKTEKVFKNSAKGLWIRNNGSTLISQFLNAVLFTFGAFYGTYEISTLIQIVFSSYIIFVVTSLLDTPFVYFAKKIKQKL